MKCPNCNQKLFYHKDSNQDICYCCGHKQDHIDNKNESKITKESVISPRAFSVFLGIGVLISMIGSATKYQDSPYATVEFNPKSQEYIDSLQRRARLRDGEPVYMEDIIRACRIMKRDMGQDPSTC